MKKLILFMVLVGVIAVACGSSSRDSKDSKDNAGYKVIGKYHFPKGAFVHDLIISPDGGKVACEVDRGRKNSLWINGQQISPEAEYIWYPTFSPDGSKIAYAVENDDKCSLWVNNASLPIKFSDRPWYLTFSNDNSKLAYWARKGNKKAVWIDGQQISPEFDDSMEPPVFSPDGSKIAYMGKMDGKYSIWINKRQISPSELKEIGHPTFSPDGKKLAYAAYKISTSGRNRAIWVNDHKFSPDFVVILSPIFISDDNKVTYAAYLNGQASLWINDKMVSPVFKDMKYPTFSLDGSKIVYVANNGGESIYINDQKLLSLPLYNKVEDLAFFPDNNKVAYRVSTVDMKTFKEYSYEKNEERAIREILKKEPFKESIYINDKKVTPEFIKEYLVFARKHFEKTGELIFAGYDKKRGVIIHGVIPAGVK